MALENATFINQFVPSNPTLSDPKSQGDDHLRMIKSVLQSTFPGLTGAVTATQAQLNVLTAAGSTFKPGMILQWVGSVSDIPAGWAFCNGVGTISTGAAVPNLVDRFIFGAGGSISPGITAGSFQHNHTIGVLGTSLTVDQLPPHSHSTDGSIMQGVTGGGGLVNINGGTTQTGTTGSGNPHTHVAGSNLVSHLPPLYGLIHIIKI